MKINTEIKMMSTPAFVFHDPFLAYPEIYYGNYPDLTANLQLTLHEVNRFADAINGWIKYMPLFLKIVHLKDEQSFEQIIQLKRNLIAPISRHLFNTFKNKKFLKMESYFIGYGSRVNEDFHDWVLVNKEWTNTLQPWLRSHQF
jgi:hypothetical protein